MLDEEKYIKEEEALKTANESERKKILAKRIKRENRIDVGFVILFLLFMFLLAITFGWIN